MALQTSGAISLLNIATEFGGSAPHSLSEYYGASSGIPTSGVISIGNFYGATAYTVPTQPTGTTTWLAYNSGTVTSPTLDFGPAKSNRYIVAIVTNEENKTVSVSSCTIGGVVATQLANKAQWSGSYGACSSIWIALVPSGTSGTVVSNKSLGRIGVKILTLEGGGGVATGSTTSATNYSTSATMTMPLSNVGNTVTVSNVCHTSAGGGGSCSYSLSRSAYLSGSNKNYGFAMSVSPQSATSDTSTVGISGATFKGRANAAAGCTVAIG